MTTELILGGTWDGGVNLPPDQDPEGPYTWPLLSLPLTLGSLTGQLHMALSLET